MLMLMDMEIRPGEVRNRVTWVGNLPADHSSQDCRVHYQLGRLDRCLDRSGAGSRHLHQCCTCTVSDLKRREGFKNKPSRNPSSHWVPLPWKELGKQEVDLDQKYLTKKSPKQCMTPSLSRQEGNPPPKWTDSVIWVFKAIPMVFQSFPLKKPFTHAFKNLSERYPKCSKTSKNLLTIPCSLLLGFAPPLRRCHRC